METETAKPYLNTMMEALIKECVHSERDRSILTDSLCNNIPYERIAEKHGLSARWVGEIVRRNKKVLLKYL